jgi:hypothetical protein
MPGGITAFACPLRRLAYQPLSFHCRIQTRSSAVVTMPAEVDETLETRG